VWVRGILQQAAQTAKRHPMVATADGQLAHRRGNNIATTAIARRLLARCFHILKQLEAAPPEKAITGRARVSHEPATRPLT
jgi:transposase